MNLVVSTAPCGPSTPGIRLQSFLGHKVRLRLLCVHVHECHRTLRFSRLLLCLFVSFSLSLFASRAHCHSLSGRFLLNWSEFASARGYPRASIYSYYRIVAFPREYWKKDNFTKVIRRVLFLKICFFGTFFTMFPIIYTFHYTPFIICSE